MSLASRDWKLEEKIELSIQRRIQDRRTGRAPPCLKSFLFVFVNFDGITRIYFHCIQHAVFTISILSSTLTTKHRICVKGHQNILRPQEFYRTGTAHPGFKIPGSATPMIFFKDLHPTNYCCICNCYYLHLIRVYFHRASMYLFSLCFQVTLNGYVIHD